ncbi:F-box protein At4g00755-like, partial [Primulina huaijiensis]|uniref:F-box protein At4g00755-like n=1 Tax=Primulina huaijiensis TaxID=1492673 RepID=UPI003CC7082F
FTSFTRENSISDAICASSTDNYPEESIKNILESSDVVNRRASYWSSKGQTDPTIFCEGCLMINPLILSMEQKNQWQMFTLPEPVSTCGGILKVELLGRVQTNELDGLYYICITRASCWYTILTCI